MAYVRLYVEGCRCFLTHKAEACESREPFGRDISSCAACYRSKPFSRSIAHNGVDTLTYGVVNSLGLRMIGASGHTGKEIQKGDCRLRISCTSVQS